MDGFNVFIIKNQMRNQNPETNSKFAPESGWVEIRSFPFGAFGPISDANC